MEVEVYKKPSIGILVTGNELVDPGKPLPIGKIYDSNATTLSSVLKEVGFRDTKIYRSTDHFEETLHCIGEALSAHDVLFISGGISVGEYDFVGKALEALGVSKVFYKVMQKPGKPLFFGKKDGKLVFALPGNPAASLTCFYVYGQMALELFSGHIQFLHTKVQALSKTVFETKGDRAHFLKAHYEQGYVTILNGQNSSMMHTFALANALVYVPSDSNQININDTVEVILLPIK
ncbi:MAG: molybdopterin molybdotransferase MoeA [Flavobacteriaceae bacterium]